MYYPNNFNSFSSIKNFIEVIKSHSEVIVYPVGDLGNNVLDYFQYADLLKVFCCVAVKETLNNNAEQKISHHLPVMPLEMLVHMKDSALVVVVAVEYLHDEIRENLSDFGFSKIIFIDDALYGMFSDALQEQTNSGKVMDWFRKCAVQKLHDMEYKITEQNEISSTHTKTFKDYQNSFWGKKVVIVANGQTLNYYKPIPDAIHIGVNHAWLREDIPIDYLFAIDNRAIDDESVRVEDGFGKIRNEIFLSRHLDHFPVQYQGFSEEYFIMRDNIKRFYLNSCKMFQDQPIYRDICHHELANFGTAVFPALHFALWTYPKEIYLVGCDTTDEDEASVEMSQMQLVKVGYARMKIFARQNYPKTEIISVNPVGLKNLFTDIFTDDYLAAQSDTTDKDR